MKFLTLTTFLLYFLFALAGSGLSIAQQIPLADQGSDATSSDLSLIDNPEAVRALVARLSDSEVRDMLLQQLDAVASKQAVNEPSDEVKLLDIIATDIPTSVHRAFTLLPTMVGNQIQVFKLFIEQLGPNGIIKTLGVFLVAVVLGLVVEYLVRMLSSRWRGSVNRSILDKPSLGEILRILTLRFVLDMSGLLAFIIVTQLVVKQMVDPKMHFILHHMLWNLILIPRMFSLVLKFAFAPNRSDLRLIHTSDESAKFLHRHLVGVAFFIGVFLSVIDLRTIPGAQAIDGGIGFWYNLAIHLYFAFIAWCSRHALIDIIRGRDDDATPLQTRVAKVYPYYALLVIVFSWVLVETLVAENNIHLVAQGVQYPTMFILLLAPIMDTVIRGLVKHLTPAIVGDGEIARQAYESTKRSYIRIGRLFVMLLVIVWITRIWGIDITNFDAANLGTRLTQSLLKFIGICAFGYLLWEIVTLLLNRKLAAEKTADGGEQGEFGGDGGGVGLSRLTTVLPLLTWFAQTTIVVITTLVALSNVGVDITPLLAGAGIVGLAIGFGAQKLVTDIVSGLFFLIDDAFRAGEYVNVEGTMGTVEKISLRAMQLRHHRGPIHTIPYGEIPKITNYSRDWTIMKLTFTVPFETDLIKVKRIFKNIGKELMDIPEFADDFIQPFKSQGVIQVDDVGIVVRGKFMVKPGKQFMIRKEIFQRVQKEFEKNGIQFARKEVRVKLDNVETNGQALSTSEINTIGAAALEASEEKPAS